MFSLKLALGVAITCWLVRSGRLDTDALRWSAIRHEHWLLIALLLCQLSSLALILGRWHLLLQAHGIGLSLRGVLVVSFRGMFAGLFVPGAIGLDGARLLYLQQKRRDKVAEGLASMFVDRVLGFLGLMVLAVICSLYVFVQHDVPGIGALLAFSTIATAASGVLVASLCGLLPDFGFRSLRRVRYLTRFVDSLSSYRQSGGTLIAAVALSVFAHWLTCVAACLSLLILGESFSWVAVMAVTPLVIFIRFLPIAPLGLGVSDGAAEILYGWIGISGGAETQMLMRAVTIVVFLLSGLAFFLKVEVDSSDEQAGKNDVSVNT